MASSRLLFFSVCILLVGYSLSSPLPAADFQKLVSDRKKRAAADFRSDVLSLEELSDPKTLSELRKKRSSSAGKVEPAPASRPKRQATFVESAADDDGNTLYSYLSTLTNDELEELAYLLTAMKQRRLSQQRRLEEERGPQLQRRAYVKPEPQLVEVVPLQTDDDDDDDEWPAGGRSSQLANLQSRYYDDYDDDNYNNYYY